MRALRVVLEPAPALEATIMAGASILGLGQIPALAASDILLCLLHRARSVSPCGGYCNADWYYYCATVGKFPPVANPHMRVEIKPGEGAQ